MFKWLTPDVVQGILRHLLTLGGGLLITKGLASQDQINSVSALVESPTTIGGVVAIAGIVMSIFHKKQIAATTTPVAATPVTTSAAPVVTK